MRYGGEHRSETRSRIVQSAAREMRGKGPDRVGVAAVMAEIFVTSSIQILQQAWTEHQRDAVATLPAPAK